MQQGRVVVDLCSDGSDDDDDATGTAFEPALPKPSDGRNAHRDKRQRSKEQEEREHEPRLRIQSEARLVDPPPANSLHAHARRVESDNERLDSTLDDGELLDGAFSDGEDDDADASGERGPRPALEEGYDFTGVVCADSNRATCVLCEQPFEVAYDAARQNLVFNGVVELRRQLCHAQCLSTRAGRGVPGQFLG